MAGATHERLAIVVLVLILLLVLGNLFLTYRLFTHTEQTCLRADQQHSLPCAAIPTRFVLEDPECADKLLRAMNVTGVRVLPGGSPMAGDG